MTDTASSLLAVGDDDSESSGIVAKPRRWDTVHCEGCSDKHCAETYEVPPGHAKFFCQGCEHWVGWCKGCADDMPELCDDCWHHVTRVREAAREECAR